MSATKTFMNEQKPRVVHKTIVYVSPDRQPVAIPQVANIIHVAFQHHDDNFITIWFERTLTANTNDRARVFSVYGTGHDIPAFAKHRGTVLADGYVWHLYEHPTTMQGV